MKPREIILTLRINTDIPIKDFKREDIQRAFDDGFTQEFEILKVLSVIKSKNE